MMQPGKYVATCWSLDGTTQYIVDAHPQEPFEERDMRLAVREQILLSVSQQYGNTPLGVKKLADPRTINFQLEVEDGHV
jgi:hypothetical protein